MPNANFWLMASSWMACGWENPEFFHILLVSVRAKLNFFIKVLTFVGVVLCKTE